MRNISEEICRKNQNMFRVQYFFFRQILRLRDKVENYCTAVQVTDGNMANAHCMLDV